MSLLPDKSSSPSSKPPDEGVDVEERIRKLDRFIATAEQGNWSGSRKSMQEKLDLAREIRNKLTDAS
jgi:hypothetical protein